MGTYGSRQLTLQGCIGCCRLPSNWRVGGGHLGCCFQLFLANFGNCGGYFFFRPAATPPPAWRGQLNASVHDARSRIIGGNNEDQRIPPTRSTPVSRYTSK